MKKQISFFSIFILIIGTFLLISCHKDKVSDDIDSGKCNELFDAYYQANLDFQMDRNDPAKCEAFVSATQDYIDNCAILTPEQKQEFQQAIDESNCGSN